MTKNSGNQIRNKMIASYPKTDREKLAGLKKFIIRNYPQFTVYMEPFMIFTKGEDSYVTWKPHLSETEVKGWLVSRTDLILESFWRSFVFELDGPIHDIKTEKTEKRNKRYELNNIPYIVINEAELKLKLGLPKSRKLTQEQINTEFDERLKEI